MCVAVAYLPSIAWAEPPVRLLKGPYLQDLSPTSVEIRAELDTAAPLAVTIALINALVTRNVLTVIWRFGDLPLLGQTNVTLQATVYGGVLGLRAVAIVLVATLYSTAVDPDDLLRLLRRSSFSSALSAAVATRMVPVLIRDSQRLADAHNGKHRALGA